MRIEKDSLGEMPVPDHALYGASTQRALINFPISDIRFGRFFIEALGVIKLCSARANCQLGLLSVEKKEAICQSALEVLKGQYDDQFVVDIFQTGSGTSTNMNANEVIASLCKRRGVNVHPNDDVNMSQSSNDVIPSAIHIAAVRITIKELVPALIILEEALTTKATQFKEILKAARTHLQDATPITLGQEFSGYAAQIRKVTIRLTAALPDMQELPLGGTAVGTGINTHPDFARVAIAAINETTGLTFSEADNHFEAQAARDADLAMSAACRGIAVALMKIANDVRWLSSGPRCGLAEISLPAVQPGSSIMPAKSNPVICESTMMVAAQVIGNDTAVGIAAQHSNFELNTMMPVLAHNLLQSLALLSSSSRNLAYKCIAGIEADPERCRRYAEHSLSIVTALNPHIGYDRAAAIAKRAIHDGVGVKEAALHEGIPEHVVAKALDLMRMTKPGI